MYTARGPRRSSRSDLTKKKKGQGKVQLVMNAGSMLRLAGVVVLLLASHALNPEEDQDLAQSVLGNKL